MKEKILVKTEVSLSQEVICQNLSNLASAYVTLCELDDALLGSDLIEAKESIVNSILIHSRYLVTEADLKK